MPSSHSQGKWRFLMVGFVSENWNLYETVARTDKKISLAKEEKEFLSRWPYLATVPIHRPRGHFDSKAWHHISLPHSINRSSMYLILASQFTPNTSFMHFEILTARGGSDSTKGTDMANPPQAWHGWAIIRCCGTKDARAWWLGRGATI